jgi:hypothetical protein
VEVIIITIVSHEDLSLPWSSAAMRRRGAVMMCLTMMLMAAVR